MQLQPASLMQPAEESRQHLHLSLLPDFHLNVKATSLLGSRAKLQGDYAFLPHRVGYRSLTDFCSVDIPKLEQIIISRLRQAVHDRYVWPRFLGVGLPRLVSKGVEPVATSQDGSTVAASAVDSLKTERGRDPIALSTPALMETIPGGSNLFNVPDRVISPPSAADLRQESKQHQQLQVPKQKKRAESAILGANDTDYTDDGLEEDMRYRSGPVLTSLDERNDERRQWDSRMDNSRNQDTIRANGRAGHYATNSMGSRIGLDPTRHGNQAAMDGNLRYRGGASGSIGTGSGAPSATGVGMASANGSLPLRRMGALNARGTGGR
jgi:hypothetical protein